MEVVHVHTKPRRTLVNHIAIKELRARLVPFAVNFKVYSSFRSIWMRSPKINQTRDRPASHPFGFLLDWHIFVSKP